jgi:predicted TIM-barrel fold metal-dependent hydrolase
VSVESGVGWVPFVLSALEWQWNNNGCQFVEPGRLRPIEYFQRQIYACSWFEREGLLAAIEILGDDNIMYETDFPHPTSMTPGPASVAQNPKDYIEDVFTKLPEASQRKILHENAARIYNVT